MRRILDYIITDVFVPIIVKIYPGTMKPLRTSEPLESILMMR
ncbi:hypothetical protein ACFL6I_09120 [candidate division KSB1 bacterium]